MPTKMIFLTSGSIFTVPTDFVSLISVECIGEGGNGAFESVYGTVPYSGGGGGAYAKIVSLSGIAIGSVYNVQVGTGGSGAATWFDSPSTVAADYGRSAVGTTPGSGGAASASVGTTTYSGGSGGIFGYGVLNYPPTNPVYRFLGSGGSAAGPSGSGITASGNGLGSYPPYAGTGANTRGPDNGFPGYGSSTLQGAFASRVPNAGPGIDYSVSPPYGSGAGGGGASQEVDFQNSGGVYIGGNGGLYGGGGGASAWSEAKPPTFGGAGAGGLIVFTYVSSNSSSSSSSSGSGISPSSSGGSGGGSGNSSNSSGWVPTSPSRQCIRLAEPQDTTIEQVNGLALTVYANVPYGLLYQNAPYFPVSGPDVLSMWSLDPQGNQVTLSINCTLYMSDNGYVFISNDNGKQYLVASINAPFFDANATAINTRNQAILANPVMPCANADRYDYPALLPNQAIPNTFYRDGVLLGSSSGPQTIIG